MDNIKVKAVDFIEDNKSKAEIEEELLNKHEEKLQAEETVKEQTEEKTPEVEAKEEVVEKTQETEKTPSSELNDESVLEYIKNRYQRDISK